MERMLLLWDEIDDLVGVGRCLVTRAVLRMTPPTRADGVATILLAGALLVTEKKLLQLW